MMRPVQIDPEAGQLYEKPNQTYSSLKDLTKIKNHKPKELEKLKELKKIPLNKEKPVDR